MNQPNPEGRAARPRRAIATALLLGLIATLAACDAAPLNTMVHNYSANAGPHDPNGGDNGVTIDLGDNRRLMMLNDPKIGEVNPNGTRKSEYQISNALLTYNTQTHQVTRHTGPLNGYGLPSARFKPANTAHYYWISNGIRQGNTVHLLLQERHGNVAPGHPDNLRVMANAVVSLSLPNLTQTGPVVRIPVPTGAAPATFGETIVPIGTHLYLYGNPRGGPYDPPQTVLARVPQSSLRDASAWRYWNGTGWSTSQAAAAHLIDDQGHPLDRLMAPMAQGGDLVGLAKGNPNVGDFLWMASPSPTHPSTIGPVAYTAPQSGQPCGAPGGKHYVYSLHWHTTSPADESLWSYSTNCDTSSNVASVYRPRFFNLDLTGAPDPCPVRSVPDTEAYVQAAYEDVVGYTPTDTSYWVNHIRTADPCRTSLVDALLRSDDHLFGLVDDMYQRFLGRSPSSGERTYWAGVLRDTQTSAWVARTILATPEAYTHAGGTDAAFVQLLFQQVLGWTASPSDITYWTGRIATSGRAEVIRLIYGGSDSIARRVNAIGTHYLGGGFDTAMRDHWRSVLTGNGGDDIGMARTLLLLTPYFDAAT